MAIKSLDALEALGIAADVMGINPFDISRHWAGRPSLWMNFLEVLEALRNAGRLVATNSLDNLDALGSTDELVITNSVDILTAPTSSWP